MKLIRIYDDGKKKIGQFFDFSIFKDDKLEEECYKDIELIEKEDVFRLLEYIMDNDNFDYDPYDNDSLQNPAQNLIYKELWRDFEDIKAKKENILQSIDEEFKPIEETYLTKN